MKICILYLFVCMVYASKNVSDNETMTARLWDAFYPRGFDFNSYNRLYGGVDIDPISKSNFQLLKERIQSTIYEADQDNFLLYLYHNRPKNNTVITFLTSFYGFIQEAMSSEEVIFIIPLLPQVISDEMAKYTVLAVHIDDPSILILQSGKIVLNSNMSLEDIDRSKILNNWYRQVYNADDTVSRLRYMKHNSDLRRYLFSRLDANILHNWSVSDEYCQAIIEYFGLYLQVNTSNNQVSLRLNTIITDPELCQYNEVSTDPKPDDMPIVYDDQIQSFDESEMQFTKKLNLTYWFLYIDPDQFSETLHSFEDAYCSGNRLAVRLGDSLVKLNSSQLDLTSKQSNLLCLFAEFQEELEQDRMKSYRIKTKIRIAIITSILLTIMMTITMNYSEWYSFILDAWISKIESLQDFLYS